MEAEDPQNQAMQTALQNPIVLRKVFENVYQSGKTLRLVSQFWNDITLSLPRPKLRVNLCPEICCNATPFQIFCITMDPLLARSISECEITDYCTHSSSQLLSSTESKLLHISGMFGPLIENFSITCESEDLFPTLRHVLENFMPSLKRLTIDYHPKESENSENISEELDNRADTDSPPCILRNLISIKINDTVENTHPEFFKMSQWVLNSAPNLTQLFYDGNRLPDLIHNRFVKRLELDMDCMRISQLHTANNIRRLNKILVKVKDHLEFLHLWSESGDGTFDAGTLNLQMPKMKKLKEFGHSMLDLFPCGGDKLQDICTARIPTLKTLRISSTTDLADVLRKIIQENGLFSGIKNLCVLNLHDPELIARLKTPFPNLESLELYQFDRNTCPLNKMGPYLKAYSSLRLKSLELDLQFMQGDNLSHFILGFSNCGEFFSGLKTLKIRLHFFGAQARFSDDLDVVEDGMAQMKEWLLGMKGLEDVSISGVEFKKETWDWVEPFIHENKIPIVFKKY